MVGVTFNPLVKPHGERQRQFTWRHIASRLDYWLLQKDLPDFVQSVNIRPAIKSDHNAILLKLLLSKQNNGPGNWKFNSCLVQDLVHKEKIKGVIQDVKLEGEKCKLSKQLLWIYSNICNTISKKCYCESKEKLEKYYLHKTKGAIIRSRVQWYEEGERNRKYFTWLEKRTSVKKCINELKTINGKKITGVNPILKEVVKYYSKLYTSENIDPNEMPCYLNSVR